VAVERFDAREIHLCEDVELRRPYPGKGATGDDLRETRPAALLDRNVGMAAAEDNDGIARRLAIR
jgi:hypothetical protein